MKLSSVVILNKCLLKQDIKNYEIYTVFKEATIFFIAINLKKPVIIWLQQLLKTQFF